MKKHESEQHAQQLHTGNMLLNYFKKRRTHRSALARKLNKTPDTLYRYQKQASMQVALLWDICHVMKHNFFKDIAAMLPPEYATDAETDDTLSNEIAALKQQIALLTAERDVLMKVVSQGK